MNVIRNFLVLVFLSATLGMSCRVYAADGLIEIGLTNYAGARQVTVETTSVNVYDNVYGDPVYSFESGAGFSVVPDGGGIALMHGGEALCEAGTLFVRGSEGITSVGGVTYRGFLRFTLRNGSISVVNVVDVEEYLYGVIPSEMPALWHKEALKAQTVAARSYMRTQAGVHSAEGYELCDTTHCQVYKGVSVENPNSNDAVNQTAGIMAYYNGKPINAVFSSSSGGLTENSENVWSGAEPYLRGVAEVAEKEFLTWSRTYTLEQLTAGLKSKGIDIGNVVSVTAAYYPSGRVAALTFNGTGGARTYQKDVVRSFSSDIDGSLPSTMFKINGYGWSRGGVWDGSAVAGTDVNQQIYIADANSTTAKPFAEISAIEGANGTVRAAGAVNVLSGGGGKTAYSVAGNSGTVSGTPVTGGENIITVNSGTLVFEGRGYGHGVGMSQYGAKGMAEAGYDYVSILKHYFTGVEVR